MSSAPTSKGGLSRRAWPSGRSATHVAGTIASATHDARRRGVLPTWAMAARKIPIPRRNQPQKKPVMIRGSGAKRCGSKRSDQTASPIVPTLQASAEKKIIRDGRFGTGSSALHPSVGHFVATRQHTSCRTVRHPGHAVVGRAATSRSWQYAQRSFPDRWASNDMQRAYAVAAGTAARSSHLLHELRERPLQPLERGPERLLEVGAPALVEAV